MDYINETNTYSNNNGEMNKEKYNYTNRNSKEQYTIMISESMNKSYANIFSDDLDGWNEEIEEYS